jgi:uncharacterized protein YprB with RNaseH-like and TPR domain
VIKLVNNQLEVDYFENVKQREGHIVTFKGHQMDEPQLSTKSKKHQMQRSFKFSEISMKNVSRRLTLTFLRTS